LDTIQLGVPPIKFRPCQRQRAANIIEDVDSARVTICSDALYFLILVDGPIVALLCMSCPRNGIPPTLILGGRVRHAILAIDSGPAATQQGACNGDNQHQIYCPDHRATFIFTAKSACCSLSPSASGCSISVPMSESLHKLTEAEVHFLIKLAIGPNPAGTLQGLRRSLGVKREQALGIATDISLLRSAAPLARSIGRRRGPLSG